MDAITRLFLQLFHLSSSCGCTYYGNEGRHCSPMDISAKCISASIWVLNWLVMFFGHRVITGLAITLTVSCWCHTLKAFCSSYCTCSDRLYIDSCTVSHKMIKASKQIEKNTYSWLSSLLSVLFSPLFLSYSLLLCFLHSCLSPNANGMERVYL